MLRGIMAAEVQDGPHKGWPLGASFALEGGKSPTDVKAALVADLRHDIEKIEAQIARVEALPDTITHS